MNILSFVKSLLPHVQKEQVTEDIRVTLGELDDTVIPCYRTAAEFFRSNKPRSKEVAELSASFYRNFDLQGGQKAPSIIGDIDRRLPHMRENLAYVSELADELLEHDIIAEGLTAKKASLIRAADHISFASRYALDLMTQVYVYESVQADANVSETMSRPPGVIKHINNNIAAFAAIVSRYGIPNKDFRKIVLAIPDISMNPKVSSVVAGLYKEKDVDPISVGPLAGFVGNPIYHIRMTVAEWQVGRYKANKEKAKELSLRLLYLKSQLNNEASPELEREIEYTQERIDKLQARCREVEEELGI